MPSVTVTSVATDADGKIHIQFGKVGIEFGSIVEARNWVRDQLTPESLRAIAIALMLTRQPSLNNPSVFANKSVSVDFTVNNWGTIA